MTTFRIHQKERAMSESKQKEYSNEEITVVWKPAVCIHSKKCWKELGEVFQPKERPWVKMDGASTAEIKAQVDKCPSGALSWYQNGDPDKGIPQNAGEVTIVPNGPIRIFGTLNIRHSDGTEETRERVTALCRCGLSANKPFCDGTHKRANWKEA